MRKFKFYELLSTTSATSLMYQLILVFNSLQLSAQNDTITYINILDSCKRYIILPDGKIFMPNQCEDDINFKGSISSGGKHYTGRSVFEKRKIYNCPTIIGEEMYQLYAENTDFEIYKLSIIDRDSFIIITGLKSGPGIDCHYSGTTVYERSDKKGCFKPNPYDRPLEIFIENYKHNTHMQLAMDQHFVEDMNIDSSKVIIKNGQFGKTHRRSSSEDLVSQKYRFYLVEKGIHEDLLQQAVPVIYAPVPSVYMPLEDRKKVIEKYRSLLGESTYFISCSRFNPGRDRVVNTTFGEVIEGNVLSFMLYSVEEYLKE